MRSFSTRAMHRLIECSLDHRERALLLVHAIDHFFSCIASHCQSCDCAMRLTKPKLGKVKWHPQIRFQIRGGLVGNCNTCSRCEAAGVHVQKTMSSRHCILPAPGIINAGRNYTNCLLGCRFGLTEAQRPCGAINLGWCLKTRNKNVALLLRCENVGYHRIS
jgi:hypothetical protein